MQIAVCDDEKVYLDCLSRKIKACFKEFEIEISLDKYLNAVSFLEQHEQNPYDVVFLDILMPEMNGLDVANRIRNLSEKTIIIFITTENHLVYESFDYRPFNFIPKDLDIFDQKLRSVIGKLMFFLQTSKTLCFDLPYGEIGKVTVGDIIYICSRSNYIDIICKSNVNSFHFPGTSLSYRIPCIFMALGAGLSRCAVRKASEILPRLETGKMAMETCLAKIPI